MDDVEGRDSEEAEGDGPTEAEREAAAQQIADEQRIVNFDTKEFTVEFYVAKFIAGSMFVPDYQRKFIWGPERQSKFIESVLIGLPIPFLFAVDNSAESRFDIIDGAQRLNTLNHFKTDGLVLSGLKKLDALNGFRFRDLPKKQRDKFDNRTIRMVVMTEATDDATRLDMFERINTGSVTANPAEVRRGAYAGPFYDIVLQCSEDPTFRRLCPLPPKLVQRGEAEELVLRFFVYSELYESFTHDVQKFLDSEIRSQNGMLKFVEKEQGKPKMEHIQRSYRDRFQRMITFVQANFPYGFAKTPTATITPRVRFEAIAVGVHLALVENPSAAPPDVTTWLNSQDFKMLTTTSASNSAPKLKARIEFVRQRLLGQ